ncbi:MBL fold metallo-hydrolase [Sphingomonas sp.]|uniref:MBL fold metallo-hydrolase n=1 Tax=Sphingomonas sp. TaxID=28214 RepID=UPI003D6C7EDE
MLNSLFAISLVVSGVLSPKSDPAVVDDPSCRLTVAKGMALDLVGTRTTPEQARDPSTAIAEIDARQSLLLLPGGRFVLRTSTMYPGEIEFRFRSVGEPTRENTIDELGWRDGDTLLADDAASSAKDYADLQMLVPGALVCEGAGRRRAGVGGVSVAHDVANRPVTLREDSAGRIIAASVGADTYNYSGWRVEDDIATPTQIQRTRAGQVIARWEDVRIRAARAEDRALLSLPEGYRAPDPSGVLRATALGKGAYRMDGTQSGYHTGFVVGTRAIALFDAPIGIEEAKAVRALVEKTAPGRAIAYIVASHVHGDHIAGLAAYPEASILTGRNGGLALHRQFPDMSAARIREVRSVTTLDLGDRTIKIFPLDSSHSTTMLVSYDLAARALFQGDLFYLPDRGPVPAAFLTGVELSRLINTEKLEVNSIVGIHGRTGTTVDLTTALAKRSQSSSDRGGIGNQFSSARPTARRSANLPSTDMSDGAR